MPLSTQRTNNLYPTVGLHHGRSILRWDPASKCSDDCCIYDVCPYTKTGKCSLEISYMNTVFGNLISSDDKTGIGDLMNDIELQRVGLHLIPLYHQLIRMKKEAFAVKQMTHINKQGSIKVNPIFAEIREIIRCISKEIQELKINEKWEAKFGAPTIDAANAKVIAPLKLKDVSIEELLQHGDPDFTESLSGK